MSFEISHTLSDSDKLILNNDISDANQWVKDAIDGKVNNCYLRLREKWIPILMDDPSVESIPATKEGFIQVVMSRDDYKDRAERDLEDPLGVK